MIGRETQNCATGFPIFHVSSIDTKRERREREGLAEGDSIVTRPDQLRDGSAGGTATGRRITIIKKEVGVTVSYTLMPDAEIAMAMCQRARSEIISYNHNA